MTLRQNIVERAYALASDGRSPTLADLGKRLRAEGFTHGDLTQLHFPLIAKSLRRLLSTARVVGAESEAVGPRPDGSASGSA